MAASQAHRVLWRADHDSQFGRAGIGVAPTYQQHD
jgi:hypothetical protein